MQNRAIRITLTAGRTEVEQAIDRDSLSSELLIRFPLTDTEQSSTKARAAPDLLSRFAIITSSSCIKSKQRYAFSYGVLARLIIESQTMEVFQLPHKNLSVSGLPETFGLRKFLISMNQGQLIPLLCSIKALFDKPTCTQYLFGIIASAKQAAGIGQWLLCSA